MQKAELDYFEAYAYVVSLQAVRLIVAITCGRKWSLYHLDGKSTFLNGELDEVVYITQSPGFRRE